MTYEDLKKFESTDESDCELAEKLCSSLEFILGSHAFKGMPRSVRFLGAGLGCIEIFCKKGRYYAVRNNGLSLELFYESDGGFEKAFRELISIIYLGRESVDFQQKAFEELQNKI